MSKYVGKIITNQAPAGYSVFFDGTGDYLSVADNAALDMGGADFTIEFWTYLVGTPSTYQAYFAKRANTATYGGVELYLTSGRTLNLQATLNGSSWGCDITTTSTVPLNTWTHVAAVRNGNTWVVYINGTAGATSGTVSGTVPDNANAFVIGAGASDGSHVMVASYISNFRVVKGTALYTAAFTPPTQLLNVTNTSLLTCNSPAIVDQSSNAFAITVNGNSAVSTFTPFTAYVPYNPALGASTPGVWTLDEAMQAAATRQWNMYDPYFQNTTLLLHGNGTNAAQNNTFLDSSTNNFTITRNGNTTQGSFSPFSQTGWSNYFDGSGDSLVTPANSAFDPSGQNVTVDFFVYLTRYASANNIVFEVGNSSVGDLQCNIVNTGEVRFTTGGNTGSTISGFTLNTWHYITCVKSGTNLTVYLNAVAGTTVSLTPNSKTTMYIGAQSGGNTIDGYISNFRYVRGSVNIPTAIPTAPLTNITNTSLLTCQSNRFVDNGTANSGSGFALTVNGNVSVQPFSPFYPTAAYTPQTIGGSGYFDGSGDAITAASNSAFGFTGDFTIEAWVYKGNNGSAGYDILASVGDGNAVNGWFIELSTNRTPRFYSPQGLVALGSTANINDNSWHHWAFVRSGSTLTIYLDGVSQASGSVTGTINYTGSALAIGGIGTLTGGWFNGYISNFRIVRGQALTSGNFTPPKSPLTPTSVGWTGANAASSLTGTVSILTNFTNAGIVDSTAKNVLETVGNAQISTAQSKFGGSSMSFNGTNSYLTYLGNNISYMGGGSWTVEMWLYPNSVSSLQGLLSFGSGTWRFFLDGTRLWYLNGAGSIAASASSLIATAQWYHIALVKNGTAITIYLNGSSVATGTDSNTYSTGTPTIGSEGAGSYLNGFIDDFRITKFARYTGNFTPQTSQWQDQ